MNPLQGLQQANPRNKNLNSAFAPGWQAPEQVSTVNPGVSGDTQFDPFMGTGWDRWLDAAGAREPGGINLGGVKGLHESDMFTPSPIAGLQAAQPQSTQPQVQMPQVHNPQEAASKEVELRQRRARMLNQDLNTGTPQYNAPTPGTGL